MHRREPQTTTLKSSTMRSGISLGSFASTSTGSSSAISLAPERWTVEKRRQEWDEELAVFRFKQSQKMRYIQLVSGILFSITHSFMTTFTTFNSVTQITGRNHFMRKSSSQSDGRILLCHLQSKSSYSTTVTIYWDQNRSCPSSVRDFLQHGAKSIALLSMKNHTSLYMQCALACIVLLRDEIVEL